MRKNRKINKKVIAKTSILVITFLFFAVFSSFVFAEQLPVKHFTSADGLASSAVTSVFRDSRGFLWFCTRDGLSRFDGREFVNYRIGENSGSTTFWALTETSDGVYWISTSDGLYRIKPENSTEVRIVDSQAKAGEPLQLNAEKISSVSPNFLFEDSRKRLWAGAGDLFLIAENGEIKIEKYEFDERVRGNRQNPNIVSADEGKDGSLWLACVGGIIRILPDNKKIFYPIKNLSDYSGTQTIKVDDQGRIWGIHNSSLFVFSAENLSGLDLKTDFEIKQMSVQDFSFESAGKISFPRKSNEMFHFVYSKSVSEKTENSLFNGIFQSADKKIWISGNEFLFVIEGENYRRMQDSNGFAPWTGRITEDEKGDFWIGTSGVLKFSRTGLTSYGSVDGLGQTNIHGIQQDTDGTVYFLHGIDWRISKITVEGIETAKFKLPESSKILWTSNAALYDKNGNWWVLAENGLYKFAENKNFKEISGQNPQKIYTVADGVKGSSLYCAFQDSKGNIWFSTRGRPDWSGLTKYDPLTNSFQIFSQADGFPDGQSPISFAEDKNGNIWFGLYAGGLIRYGNGKFTDFSKDENLPQGGIFGLFADEKNRLWIGSTRDGLTRLDDVSADKLNLKRYTTADGLISNNIRTLTGDEFGNIYAGTVRGISRVSPETGNIRHYTTADGLAADFVTSSLRDRNGVLWFGTADGISKLFPEPENVDNNAPQVWISGLSIAGNRYSVSDFGQKEISEIAVGSTENNLQIEFFSIGNPIRYQYKLESDEISEWSPPSAERRVNFANLAPDAYKFFVRAVDENGQSSENPAVITFTINPPFYRTWWFLAFAFLTVASAIFTLDRYRVSKTRQVQKAYDELQKSERERREAELALQKSREERLAELERVRTRIATDLHDDIGSSLTQIAVLSQAVQSQVSSQNTKIETPLERISTVSVELVNAMSDIVWAINPRKDNLRDLVQRMRRFAADVFTAKGIKFEFDAPDIESKIQLGANIRREVFAIYKEAVNNSVKHSNCTNAEISLKIADDILILQISDNGCGFDLEEMIHNSQPPSTYGGNGLINIQKRGAELGGRCEIISFPNGGTIILLEIPLHQTDAVQTASENGKAKELK